MMLKLCALFAVFISGAAASGTWGYGKTVPGEVYGPADWGVVSPFCKAHAQSPVNIDTSSVIEKEIEDDARKVLRIYFSLPSGYTKGTLSNNGHSPTLTVEKGGASLVNPINGQKYKLAQFHFHFGCEDNVGSEHTVDGKAFPGEVHFVFYNTKYKDLSAAATQADGLTVVGAFLYKDWSDNKELSKLSAKLRFIEKEGSKIEGVASYLKYLIPRGDENLEYFSYKGSLTTPGCFESVSWIVLKKQIQATSSVLQAFRRLEATHGKYHGKMCDNYRPTQPLNGRKVTLYADD